MTPLTWYGNLTYQLIFNINIMLNTYILTSEFSAVKLSLQYQHHVEYLPYFSQLNFQPPNSSISTSCWILTNESMVSVITTPSFNINIMLNTYRCYCISSLSLKLTANLTRWFPFTQCELSLSPQVWKIKFLETLVIMTNHLNITILHYDQDEGKISFVEYDLKYNYPSLWGFPQFCGDLFIVKVHKVIFYVYLESHLLLIHMTYT